MASLVYRQHDVESLREFVRRLTFCVLISNGDCHLKNWSLIYTDPRSPRLSPAYDLVSTAYYSNGQQEDLALKFRKSRRFSSVSVTLFQLLERRLGAGGAGLAECALDTVRRVNAEWPSCAEHLDTLPELRSSVEDSIRRHSKSLRQGSPDVG